MLHGPDGRRGGRGGGGAAAVAAALGILDAHGACGGGERGAPRVGAGVPFGGLKMNEEQEATSSIQ